MNWILSQFGFLSVHDVSHLSRVTRHNPLITQHISLENELLI